MAVESQVALSDRLRAYLEAWNSLDPVAVKSRYLDDGTHRGRGVVMLYPRLEDSTIHGNEAIYDFAVLCRDVTGGSAGDWVVTWALEAGSTSIVEYDIRSEVGEQKWAEITQWDGDRVRQTHLYVLATAG
jgi:hypothetical protein